MKANLYAIILVSCLVTCINAQVSSYSFSQTTSGTYGSALTGSQVGISLQDDDVTAISLPFTFKFNGTNYTSVNVCSNGFLSFSSLSGTEYYPISDFSTSEVISPFGTDLVSGILTTGNISSGSNSITSISFPGTLSVGDTLVDLYGDFNSQFPVITQISGSTIVLNTTATGTYANYDIFIANGRIRRAVTGSSPNRILTFELRNYSRYFEYDEALNFKIRLYETSNKIEFVYGNIIAGYDYSTMEVGLKGTSTSDYN